MHRAQNLLGPGFQLAHFIISDRLAAIQIVGNAASKLGVQRSRERKRAYWRYKHLKRKITRIIREDSDLFQWLIYFEAEQHERWQEQAGQLSMEDFVVRYIKHLLQAATPMSSFYVNIGLLRLLHNYSTAESRSLYEWLTDHYPENEEYRKVKGSLLNGLQARFGNILKVCHRSRGGIRFEPCDNQTAYVDLVEQCLRMFTPWSTNRQCWVSRVSEPAQSRPSQFLKQTLETKDADTIEAFRSHALIHPPCLENLVQRVGLDSPQHRLAIPKLFLSNDIDGQGRSRNSRQATYDLTDEERQAIQERLETKELILRQIVPRVLRIVVDHVECVQLDVAQYTGSQCELPRHARFIEIWGGDEGEDALVATHWIDYSKTHLPAPVKAIVDLPQGKTLLLNIEPTPDSAMLMLECRPKRRWTIGTELYKRAARWKLTSPLAGNGICW